MSGKSLNDSVKYSVIVKCDYPVCVLDCKKKSSTHQHLDLSLSTRPCLKTKVTPKRINKRVQPTFYTCCFFTSHSHSQSTQLPLVRYQVHCVLKNAKGNERQLHCLRFLRSSRQVECARKNRQLSDLYVLMKSLVILQTTITSRHPGVSLHTHTHIHTTVSTQFYIVSHPS